MTARKYNFLTWLCLLIAVLSAAAYGKLGVWNWLAPSVAVVSALVAAAIYFYNVDGSSR
jgi:hypothetical protein